MSVLGERDAAFCRGLRSTATLENGKFWIEKGYAGSVNTSSVSREGAHRPRKYCD